MAKLDKTMASMKDTQVFDARAETDTLRLWENYRDQALLWRALALFQMPATILLVIFSILLWTTRTIELKVPSKPLPGSYLAQDVPDTEFVEAAQEFLNLITTYQPAVARRQFMQAREMQIEPLLSRFEQEMINGELKAIEATSRSQFFFHDPVRIEPMPWNSGHGYSESGGNCGQLLPGHDLYPLADKDHGCQLGALALQLRLGGIGEEEL